MIRAGELRNQFRSQRRKMPVFTVVETASLDHYDTLFGLTPDAPTPVAVAS